MPYWLFWNKVLVMLRPSRLSPVCIRKPSKFPSSVLPSMDQSVLAALVLEAMP